MNAQELNKKITIRNLVIFTVIVLTIGFIGRGLDVAMGNPTRESLGILLWISMPLVTSLILRLFAGDGWKDFGIKPNCKGNLGWYLFAVLVFPFVTAVILLVGYAFGLITFPEASAATLGLFIQAFALAMLPNLIKNFFEEAAWRGYLTPKIFSLGINDFIGHTIVGVIWGVWHIPYYLFYEDPAVLQEFTTLNMATYIPLAIVVMIAWAFVYGEIRLLTNSIWPVILMHAVEDAFLFALILDHHIVIRQGMDWLISPMNGLVCVALFLVIGVGLRQWRKRKNKSLVTESLGLTV